MNIKQLSYLLFLTLAAAASAQQRPTVKYDKAQLQQFAARMNRITSTNFQDGFNFGQELASLPSPVGYEILRDNWNKGASLASREQMFKGFVFGNHPDTILVLNLGMRDPHFSMQAWSMAYLQQIAFEDFSTDFGAYDVWFSKYKLASVSDAKKGSLADALAKVVSMPEGELDDYLDFLSTALANASIDSWPDVRPALERVNRSLALDASKLGFEVTLLKSNSLSHAFAADLARQLLARPEFATHPRLLQMIGNLKMAELTDQFMALLKAKVASHASNVAQIAQILLDTDDPRVYPFVIGLLPTLGAGEAAELELALGNSLRLTRNQPHTVAWWQDWLAKNKGRFATDFEAASPKFQIDAVDPVDYIPDADDVKDIPDRSFLVDGDPQKRFIVSGDYSDGKPKKLFVIMPGGDGSAEFHPFVKRIQKNCLDESWIVAEPIAPNWDEKADRVVWPGVGNPYSPAKFTMETFVDGMLDDLASKLNVKISQIYMLGWSSSGPALYSYAAHGRHSIDGVFVAMSIFNKGLLGSATELKAKRFYLLHSPQDFIPIAQAQAGLATLTDMGIPARLTTYDGGHGWHGPIYEEIAEGLKFLTSEK